MSGRDLNNNLISVWMREIDEFSELCAQLVFDAARAVVLLVMFWIVSNALHISIINQSSDASITASALHFLHSAFLVVASFLTLSYTLMRIAAGPIHEVYQTLARVKWERGGVRDKEFLDVELELQAALVRESRTLRFQGFRMNEALKRPEFFAALGSLDEIKLIFMAPFENPTDNVQRIHNVKFEESIGLLRDLFSRSPNVRLDMRVTALPPSENILMFDEDRARIRPVKKGAAVASHSDLKRISRGKNGRELDSVLSRFESRFAEATKFPIN